MLHDRLTNERKSRRSSSSSFAVLSSWGVTASFRVNYSQTSLWFRQIQVTFELRLAAEGDADQLMKVFYFKLRCLIAETNPLISEKSLVSIETVPPFHYKIIFDYRFMNVTPLYSYCIIIMNQIPTILSRVHFSPIY